MSTCAIMQPTYLPWSGYFALVERVDTFVFLDDVQFSRNSWQSMNRFLRNGTEFRLTVPNVYAPLSTKISAIEVDDAQNWRTLHLDALEHAYEACPFGREAVALVRQVLAAPETSLSKLNMALIEGFSALLDIETSFVRATELGCGGRRSEHVALICEAVGCTSYLSPRGAKDYLEADRFEESFGLELAYLDFEPAPYLQPDVESFVSHLSLLDVIANIGPRAAGQYIRGVI